MTSEVIRFSERYLAMSETAIYWCSFQLKEEEVNVNHDFYSNLTDNNPIYNYNYHSEQKRVSYTRVIIDNNKCLVPAILGAKHDSLQVFKCPLLFDFADI